MAFIPFFNIRNENDDIVQRDTYDVYVNDEFIGRKVLYSESEEITNLSDYLSSNGYGDFTYTEDGNKFIIEDYDEEEAEKMKNQLETYLNIR